MKTYTITLSRRFPQTHKRAGEQTFFVEKLLSELLRCGLISNQEIERLRPYIDVDFFNNCIDNKLHTLRLNYRFWESRVKQIQYGKAILSIRFWKGMPYNSKQVEICSLGKDSGMGIQKLEMTPTGWFIDDFQSDITTPDIAKNDGLTPMDFSDWFRGKISIEMEPIAIIHITKMRY